MDKNASYYNEQESSASAQLQKVKALLTKKRPRDAYELLQNAVMIYADDPYLLSYYGYLKAAVDGKYRSGIEDCTRALALFQRMMLRGDFDGDEKHKALLFLNLAKAYSAAGKRKDAYDSLNKGLLMDIQNDDILVELQKLGIRKRVAVPFLERSNPINNFFGKMLRKPDNEPSLS